MPVIGAIKSRVWKQKLLPVVAPVTWGSPPSISAKEALVCLQEGLPASPVHTHRLLCGFTEVSQRKLTVEAVWPPWTQIEAMGLSTRPSYVKCVPSSKHTEGTKPAMWNAVKMTKKVCQVPTGSWH